MFRSLRRVVWLTAAQRDTVLQSARLAALRPDNVSGQDTMAALVNYLQELAAAPIRPARITLVVNGLKLPPDCLPVWMTDEEVDLLVIWGNLPPTVSLLAKPDPTLFPDPRTPRPDHV